MKPTTTDTGGTSTTTQPTTETTTGTATTSTILYAYDCTQPNPPIQSGGEVGSYGPAEDFDFDANGYAIQVFDGNLVARNKAGDDSFVIAPLGSSWTSGTRVLQTGDILVADSNTSEVVRVDPTTGGDTTVFTQAGWPNGIEVDSEGYAYVSDFSGSDGFVARFDPYNPTDMDVLINGISYPNGLVLSPDEQTLYIASTDGQIIAVDRLGPVEWDSPRVLYDAGGAPQGIHVDICGNVYWTDGTTSVLRVAPNGSNFQVVAELNQAASGYLPNLRWGNGVGGWEVDHLYASDRFAEVMFDIDVGIPGKKHVMYWP